MNDKYMCSIKGEKIYRSLELLMLIKNYINNSDLNNDIDSQERELENINFEHGNCVEFYKRDFEMLFYKIEEVKRNINLLVDSLSYSVEKYNNATTIDNGGVKTLAQIYDKNPMGNALMNLIDKNTDNMESIATSLTNSVFPETLDIEKNQQDNTYSTIPIGLGIAATGISAAVGTCYVDSKFDSSSSSPSTSKNKFVINNYFKKSEDSFGQIDSYNEAAEEEEEEKEVAEPYPKYEEESVLPYHASRDSAVSSKFYKELDNNDDLNLDSYDE